MVNRRRNDRVADLVQGLAQRNRRVDLRIGWRRFARFRSARASRRCLWKRFAQLFFALNFMLLRSILCDPTAAKIGVVRPRVIPHANICASKKRPFHGHFRDSVNFAGALRSAPPRARARTSQKRTAPPRRRARACAIHVSLIRKMFFSFRCSNRNAVPAIRVGADATPPLDLARRAAW